MTIEFISAGIQSQPAPEDRDLVFLDILYNGNSYKWQIYVPVGVNLSEYLESQKTKIQQQIDAKEAEWEALTPKTRTIENPFGNTITVDITKDEIVKPDIPDYYARRRAEYPAIGDQLDALWKGVNSPEFINVMSKIQEVKDKYPKS